ALVGNGFSRLADFFLVAKVVVFHRLEVVVQLIYQRHTGGYVQLDDFLVGNAAQVLDQGAQAVAVGDDQDLFAGLDLRLDLCLEIRDEARHCILQAFAQRNIVFVQVTVDAEVAGITLVAALHRRRRNVVAATPDQYLFVTVLGRGLGLVQALQRTLVTLVQAPVADHRNPHQVDLVLDDPQGADGTLEYRGEGDIELETGFLEQLAGFFRLGAALVGQVHIFPAGEAVFLVPQAVAVAHEYQFGR